MTQNYSIFQPADVFFRARKIDFSTLLPLSQPPTHQFCYSGKISPAPPARPSQININPINNLKHWIIHVQLMWPKGHLRPSPRLGHHQTSSSSSTILVLLENARKAGKSARFAGLCNKPRNSEQKKKPVQKCAESPSPPPPCMRFGKWQTGPTFPWAHSRL